MALWILEFSYFVTVFIEKWQHLILESALQQVVLNNAMDDT